MRVDVMRYLLVYRLVGIIDLVLREVLLAQALFAPCAGRSSAARMLPRIPLDLPTSLTLSCPPLLHNQVHNGLSAPGSIRRMPIKSYSRGSPTYR